MSEWLSKNELLSGEEETTCLWEVHVGLGGRREMTAGYNDRKQELEIRLLNKLQYTDPPCVVIYYASLLTKL